MQIVIILIFIMHLAKSNILKNYLQSSHEDKYLIYLQFRYQHCTNHIFYCRSKLGIANCEAGICKQPNLIKSFVNFNIFHERKFFFQIKILNRNNPFQSKSVFCASIELYEWLGCIIGKEYNIFSQFSKM